MSLPPGLDIPSPNAWNKPIYTQPQRTPSEAPSQPPGLPTPPGLGKPSLAEPVSTDWFEQCLADEEEEQIAAGGAEVNASDGIESWDGPGTQDAVNSWDTPGQDVTNSWDSPSDSWDGPGHDVVNSWDKPVTHANDWSSVTGSTVPTSPASPNSPGVDLWATASNAGTADSDEVICPEHGILCKKGVCAIKSKLVKQKEREASGSLPLGRGVPGFRRGRGRGSFFLYHGLSLGLHDVLRRSWKL